MPCHALARGRPFLWGARFTALCHDDCPRLVNYRRTAAACEWSDTGGRRAQPARELRLHVIGGQAGWRADAHLHRSRSRPEHESRATRPEGTQCEQPPRDTDSLEADPLESPARRLCERGGPRGYVAGGVTLQSSSRNPAAGRARSSSAWAGPLAPMSASPKAASTSRQRGNATYTAFASATSVMRFQMRSSSVVDVKSQAELDEIVHFSHGRAVIWNRSWDLRSVV